MGATGYKLAMFRKVDRWTEPWLSGIQLVDHSPPMPSHAQLMWSYHLWRSRSLLRLKTLLPSQDATMGRLNCFTSCRCRLSEMGTSDVGFGRGNPSSTNPLGHEMDILHFGRCIFGQTTCHWNKLNHGMVDWRKMEKVSFPQPLFTQCVLHCIHCLIQTTYWKWNLSKHYWCQVSTYRHASQSKDQSLKR